MFQPATRTGTGAGALGKATDSGQRGSVRAQLERDVNTTAVFKKRNMKRQWNTNELLSSEQTNDRRCWLVVLREGQVEVAVFEERAPSERTPVLSNALP